MPRYLHLECLRNAAICRIQWEKSRNEWDAFSAAVDDRWYGLQKHGYKKTASDISWAADIQKKALAFEREIRYNKREMHKAEQTTDLAFAAFSREHGHG